MEQRSHHLRIRALEQLRRGVEDAIVQLGQGFLTHPANHALRERIHNRELTADDYLHQLLRLVYRMLFLLVAEARDLLLDPEADDITRRRYTRFYSMARLAELAQQPRRTAHSDLWQSLQVTIGALDAHSGGLAQLGLPALGSFLWSPTATPDLNRATIDNRHLLNAIYRLCYTRDPKANIRWPVDYRNLGTEELGSVYESLLELHAQLNGDARTFALASAAGSERKTTGSYYTPTPLIDRLLDDTLNPLLDHTEQSSDPETALLALRVLDPACGSGHFLINAAHRIAGRLATIRAGGTEPNPEELRTALRDAIGRCVYGIDINPLAVELCKIALWVEANSGGQPLSYLDHHIVCGNSLLGTTPELVAEGIPQTAFTKLDGDDPKHLAQLRKTNLRERKLRNQQMLDLDWSPDHDIADLAEDMAVINTAEDTTTGDVTAKADLYNELQQSDTYTRAKLAADAWCAAFVTTKTANHPAITDSTIRSIGQGHRIRPETRDQIAELADQYQFLHPHIAFPDIHKTGGFTAVVGNPPWDQIQYDPRETFAVSHPHIAAARTMAIRNQMIALLAEEEPETYTTYLGDVRHLAGVKHFLHQSGKYPLSSVGRLNTAPLFVELMWQNIDPEGRVGVVAPTGIATDSFTQGFFNAMVDRKALVSLYDFENRKGIFPSVHRSSKFCLLTLSSEQQSDKASFVFFAHEVADIDNPDKNYTLTPRDFTLFNPNTRTAPTFRNRRDAEITTGIYRRVPVLINEGKPDGNPWNARFHLMFMMNTDSGLFRTRSRLEEEGWTLRGNHFHRGDDIYVALYVSAMVHQYDHRWATFENGKFRDATGLEKQDPTFVAQPQYWVPVGETNQRIGDNRPYLLGWRDVTNATNERSVIITPHPRAGAGNPLPQFVTPLEHVRHAIPVTATMNSFGCDYVARQKLGGTHLNFFYMKQLAVLPPGRLGQYEAFIESRVLELCYTAWDMAPFGGDLGWDGPPFRWDAQRRALIRAELDALMFRLYGIDRADADYILDTFAVLQKDDLKRWGEYRTKRLTLERYNAMVEADRKGQPYQTILDPPPADPAVAHDWSTRPDWYLLTSGEATG